MSPGALRCVPGNASIAGAFFHPGGARRIGCTEKLETEEIKVQELQDTFFCILLPFLGTSLGAAAVFFLRRRSHPAVHKGLLGFASGVMLAAMVWSLLMPAITMAEAAGEIPWLPAAVGFLAGIGGLLGLDRLLSRAERQAERQPGDRRSESMLLLAVTLHNLPEGMAVGVAAAGVLAGSSGMTAAGAMALSMGVAIQNIPEGAIISAPLAAGGMPRGRAFGCGVLSGAVEPVGAVLTLLLTRLVTPLLPYVLAFAAGTMLYVVSVELIPETQRGQGGMAGAIGTALGFVLMMVLDVALG